MTNSTYSTWLHSAELESAMTDEHGPIWAKCIERFELPPLENMRVLDFGCNRGGMLRLLYDINPFRSGLGVDRAIDSIEHANLSKGRRPVDFQVADSIPALDEPVHFIFSHEVIYLVGNLSEHMRQAYAALSKGGVYYAVLGCHTENPLWPCWKTLIENTSQATVFDYSPEDVVNSMTAAGFKVSVKPLGWEREPDAHMDKQWYPTPKAYKAYYASHKLIFCGQR